MAHELPPLPYPKEALEPHIDAPTMESITTAITRLTWTTSTKPSRQCRAGGQIAGGAHRRPRVRAGQHRGPVRKQRRRPLEHSFFWKILAPKAGGAPSASSVTPSRARSARFADFRRSLKRLVSDVSAAAGPGSSRTAEAGNCFPPRIRTIRSWAKPSPASKASRCWAWMSGSMRII